MNVLIVDDEPLARELLRTLLSELPDIQGVDEAVDGMDALAKFEARRPDLIFIDIEMPGLNGVHAGLRLAAQGAAIIFVTAHEAHALDAFEVGAVDYLLKPVRRPRLATAVERARRQRIRRPSGDEPVQPAAGAAIWVPIATGATRVPVEEIVRVQAAGDHVYLHTARRAYLYRTTMANLEQRLQGSSLVRVHRSAFLRPEQVVSVFRQGKRLTLRLQDGAAVAVGANYRDAVLAVLAERGL